MQDIRTFLEDWGIWSILILFATKFVLGVIVAVQKNEFKWFYVGNVFKTDGLKVTTFAVMTGLSKFSGIAEFNSDYVQGAMGAVLVADFIAGIVKNLAHLFPTLSDSLNTSLREPSRLRLGNPKNLPS